MVAFRRAGRPFSPVGETPISRPAVLVIDPANGAISPAGVKTASTCLIASPSTARATSGWPTPASIRSCRSRRTAGSCSRWGRPRFPGRTIAHFNQPSGVTAAADGTFYVSDGYGNTRVVHFFAGRSCAPAVGRPGQRDPASSTCRTGSCSGATASSTSRTARTGAIQSFDTQRPARPDLGRPRDRQPVRDLRERARLTVAGTLARLFALGNGGR